MEIMRSYTPFPLVYVSFVFVFFMNVPSRELGIYDWVCFYGQEKLEKKMHYILEAAF